MSEAAADLTPSAPAPVTDPWQMTPGEVDAAWQAAIEAHAAKMNPPAADKLISQMSPQEASAQLDKLMNTAKWVTRLEAGEARAKEEFTALCSVKAGADRVGEILAGNDAPLPFQTTIGESAGGDGLTDADLRIAVKTLRAAGVNDDSVRQAIEGKPVTKAERRMVEDFKRSREGDPTWIKALFDGDLEARREHALMAIVLAAPVKEAA